jgi:hypothetical protein
VNPPSREACLEQARRAGVPEEKVDAIGGQLYRTLRDLAVVDRALLRDVEPTLSLTVERWPER